jgi:hypothetical protein
VTDRWGSLPHEGPVVAASKPTETSLQNATEPRPLSCRVCIAGSYESGVLLRTNEHDRRKQPSPASSTQIDGATPAVRRVWTPAMRPTPSTRGGERAGVRGTYDQLRFWLLTTPHPRSTRFNQLRSRGEAHFRPSNPRRSFESKRTCGCRVAPYVQDARILPPSWIAPGSCRDAAPRMTGLSWSA